MERVQGLGGIFFKSPDPKALARWYADAGIAALSVGNGMERSRTGGASLRTAMALPALDKQFFPDFELNSVSVSMPYRGAGPSEVEEQICVRIEEAVHDLNGVKEIRSSARQGIGTVTIEARSREQLDAIYHDLSAHDDILMAL